MKLCVTFMFLALIVVINGGVEDHPPDSLKSIKLIPEGPHCPDTEVIAGLASGEKVCLNPRSSWVKKLIQYVLEKQLHQQGGALPKNQA
ncbi:interleukin-8-like protein [Lates japonicus]|uniref:Interleukin-8-like protein n=1 Tax=Lates japonicus TaxID=270547 RepID=A0AAD3R1K5_LATJO|nr:interleukin-8-like protein [Lates japonicus]